MAAEITGRRRPTKPKRLARAQKRKREHVDVEKLAEAVENLDANATFKAFDDLPLSDPTKAGLKAAHFTALTDIQAKVIGLGLKGSDVLGAAKTGSGKTLAFLIPVLENLYRQQCVGSDAGLGAMIICPTRELAIQIFDVLVKIGKHGHLFAAGLVIGGKSLQEEQHALGRMNIVVCTPGRILQHLSQTASFQVDSLKMLVLDEADRIMDMGFQRDVDAIIEYLPPDRQTLLFSATQTKRVSDLARLSLRDPEYVAVHEAAVSATPKTLQQNYVVTPLPTKLDTLWSFLQSAKKSKLLVFLSTGKQVRFVYEVFRRLQPGIPLLHLHGRQKQAARLETTQRFSAASHSCLFATDVVARGLDFPAVDWVVQLDCPEDADTYVHRVGRTARYERDGRAVLFLDDSEEAGMLARLEQKKVPIEKINIRAKRQTSIRNQIQNMCFKDPELKYLGQKAFASYVRSVYLQKDKDVFKVQELPLEEYAESLGLPGAPRIKYLSGAGAEEVKRLKNAPRYKIEPDPDDEGSNAEDAGQTSARSKSKDQKERVRTRYDRMFERQNQNILSEHYARMIDSEKGEQASATGVDGDDASTSGEDDLFAVKRRIAPRSPSPSSDGAAAPKALQNGFSKHEPLLVDSKRREKALKSKKKVAKIVGASGNKVVFDEDGTAWPAHPFEDETSLGDATVARTRFLETERERMIERDERDKVLEKEKKRTKKEKKKAREKGTKDVNEAVTDDEAENSLPATVKLPFEELQDLFDSASHSDAESGADEPSPPTKKWFERDGKRAKAEELQRAEQSQPQTLEDLEALASSLLG